MGIIRLILAVSVIIAHSGNFFGLHFMGGKIAVQTFYVISGFYMSLILNEKYKDQKGSYFLFLSNRFLRIMPLYWCVLTLVLLGSIFSYYTGGLGFEVLTKYVQHFKEMNILTLIFLVFSNIFLFFQDIIMFLGINIKNGFLFFFGLPSLSSVNAQDFLFIPQAWTVGIELTFYIVAPFIVRRSMKLILGLMFLSVVLRVYLMSAGLNMDPWTYRFFPTELVFFLLGSISYWIYKKMDLFAIKPLYYRLSLLVTLLLISLFECIHSKWYGYVFILLFSLLLPFVFTLSKKWKRDAYVGDLSYPLYISHVFIISLFALFGIRGITNTGDVSVFYGLGVFLASLVLSVILNELVSKKIEKIRQRRALNLSAKSNL